jgi:hypothetical protein
VQAIVPQSSFKAEPSAEHEYVARFDVELRREVVCVDARFSAYERDHAERLFGPMRLDLLREQLGLHERTS